MEAHAKWSGKKAVAQSINQSGGRDCVRQVHRSFGEPPGNPQPPRLLMNRSHLDSSDNSLICTAVLITSEVSVLVMD